MSTQHPPSSRRGVLAGLTGLAASPALAGAPRLRAPGDPFAPLDATAQADLVARGEVTAGELVEAAIRRAETLNPTLNAIVTPLYGAARAAAGEPLPEGPFRGVPFLVKDLDDLAGVRRTSGSRLLLDNVSTTTEPIIARSLAAGFVVLGKSNTPEFALSATTEPLALGAARNPWALDRSTGGSSGGAAAAVAAGLAPIAHASDGGGSIRIPASCCGLFGLKPSRGRMVGSRNSPTEFGVEHCVARSVRDSARLFAWNERRDADAPLSPIGWISTPSPARRRIAFATRDMFGREPTPGVKATVEHAGRVCEALGHRVEPASLPVDGAAFIAHFMVAWSSSGDHALKLAEQAGRRPDTVLEPWTLYLADHFRRQAAGALPKALAYFAELGARWASFYERYDLVLTPVVHSEPPRLGFLRGDTPGPILWDRMTHYAAYTALHNAIGAPAMSVPLWSGTLPVGCQFSAAWGREQTLFELAYQLEQTSAWRAANPVVDRMT